MVKVKLSIGEIEIDKPTAGARNKAIMKAETADGIKQTVMLVELLPMCVKSHPFGVQPVKQSLDGLSIEDYDKLIDALAKILSPPEKDVEKKSVEPSKEDTSRTGGSVKS